MSRDVDFFRARIPEFREAEERFFVRKDLSAKEYKGISGKFGSYAQKGGELGMIRLRMCGGHMSKDKLSFIIDECRRYGITRIHTTTCETVQLHNLRGDQICEIMDRALDHGINTQGGGGDNPRNVSATSLSGVEPGEKFDVYPYAKATETYLLDIMTDIRMPRKLKVTFSSSERNETHATFRDLGFIANDDGTFDVWAAGGLGNNPKLGIRVAEGIDPSKTIYYVRAMVDATANYEGCVSEGVRFEIVSAVVAVPELDFTSSVFDGSEQFNAISGADTAMMDITADCEIVTTSVSGSGTEAR